MIRARTWALRVLRFLDWLTPTVREAWVYGVGSLVPFLVLVGGRIFVMKQRTSPPQGWDTLSVQIGEMEFWGVWVMVFVLLGRVPWRRWRSVLRVLLHVCIMLVLAPTLADLNFFLAGTALSALFVAALFSERRAVEKDLVPVRTAGEGVGGAQDHR